MALPPRVFFTLQEIADRWGCPVSDMAGWAAMGTLKIVTGIPPIECGELRVAGLVQIQPTDVLPMFRRCGTGPHEAHLKRVRQLDREDWLYITAPEEGVLVSFSDLLILGQEVQRFEVVHNIFGRVAESAGLGDDGDYDWTGMNVEITRRVFEEGLPKSQGEWIRELQDWFAARSETGEFPDERSIRRRLTPILKALKFKNPPR
ncbi:hypothetical protein [Antarctobacter heliothermus]|uniref:Uncharacterized protein n=1 Tax=Antarctobacter heliothermus TaxID=74033 RepID=A0A239KKM8_9RHOB|nr:hypothetical protein [Antarctobacter heliothermus]SNT18149.1 hypothetical protein SAMN04488078_106616 [Antarctobacter heliothermus]